MGKIAKMSLHLANMIAAGEVVERPSNVVKELVENSIDANSTNIKIILSNGGIDLIKVVDDGDGMDKDDVLLAFMPHATSKIKTEYDLFRINTLGFRGEAISSIASVSTMQIISSQTGLSGYQCTYKSGVKQNEGVTHSNKGTTVIVNNLFFNTPARLKYLKSAKSELASIMFWVDRIALAHPSIRFTVISDEKTVFQTTGSKDEKTLIGELYGIEACKNVIMHSYTEDGYSVKLVLVKPSIYRSNKLEITMICNGRYVKNYNITNAVIEGFNTYLPIGKYPIGVLYFEIDSTLVDVNVHPQKTEIKISDEEEICRILKTNIKKCLEENTHIPSRIIEHNNNPKYDKVSIFNSSFSFGEEKTTYVCSKEESGDLLTKSSEIINNDNSANISVDRKNITDFNDKAIIDEKNKEENIKPASKKIPYMEYVGQIFGTYLIFQNQEGMLMVDQHAAQERINYEKYYKILALKNQPTTELLVPDVLSFTKEEALYVEQNINSFLEIGFRLEQIGQRDFVVREVPLWIKLDNLSSVVNDIITLLIDNKKIDIMFFRDHIAKSIACKASIKANHRINADEVKALLSDLELCENPYTCPHGRPTIIKLSLKDIEKMFERIQK